MGMAHTNPPLPPTTRGPLTYNDPLPRAAIMRPLFSFDMLAMKDWEEDKRKVFTIEIITNEIKLFIKVSAYGK